MNKFEGIAILNRYLDEAYKLKLNKGVKKTIENHIDNLNRYYFSQGEVKFIVNSCERLIHG